MRGYEKRIYPPDIKASQRSKHSASPKTANPGLRGSPSFSCTCDRLETPTGLRGRTPITVSPTGVSSPKTVLREWRTTSSNTNDQMELLSAIATILELVASHRGITTAVESSPVLPTGYISSEITRISIVSGAAQRKSRAPLPRARKSGIS